MKLDKLFEKFLSLFKKETSELEDSDSTILRRSRSDRKKLAQVGPIRKFWRRYHLTKIILILGLSAGLLVGIYLFAVAKSTNVNDLQNALKTRTLIFDREEKEAGALSGQKGTYVELTDISKNLQNAVIATEDRSFYKNDGLTMAVSSWLLSLLDVQVVALPLPNSWLKTPIYRRIKLLREKRKNFSLP